MLHKFRLKLFLIDKSYIYFLVGILFFQIAFVGSVLLPQPETIKSKNNNFYESTYCPKPQSAISSPRIFIDGNNLSQDWDNCPWVNGSGTSGEPYVIKDLDINGDRAGSCIFITNTRECFKIENCTLFNAPLGISDGGICISNSTNATISKNYCYGSGIGIYLSSASNVTLSGNNCSNNVFFGTYLSASSNNSLTGNNCSRNLNGINLLLSPNNTLNGNDCSESGEFGILLNNSPNNTLSGNLMNHCGIFLRNNRDDSILTSIDTTNFVNGKPVRFFANQSAIPISGDPGQILLAYCNDTIIQHHESSCIITLYCSFNNTIYNNNCSDNERGIYLEQSSNNNITKNVCTGNTKNGIDLFSSSNNTISGNNCTGNHYSGIRLQSSSNNTIDGNIIIGNSQAGINLFQDSHNNTISANNCTDSLAGIGIAISYSSNNTIRENTCAGNDKGIYLGWSSMNDLIVGNNCSENVNGISINNSPNNNTVCNNTCLRNMGHGIYLFSSTNKSITGNNCSWNSLHGIYLKDSSFNNLTGNNCSRNVGHGILLERSNSTEVGQNLAKKNNLGQIAEVDCIGNYIHDNTIVNPLVVTLISNNTAILLGQSVSFQCFPVGGVSPFTYHWDFADGSSNSTISDPVHAFHTIGNYIVTLTVVDLDGDVAITCITIFVYEQLSKGIDGYNFLFLLVITGTSLGLTMKWFYKKVYRRTR